MGLDVVRIDFHGFPVLFGGLDQSSLFLPHHGQVIVKFGVARPQMDRLFVAFRGFGGATFCAQGSAEVIEGVGEIGLGKAYEAFGRRDIPAFLKLVADEVDWKFIGPASWPHAGLRRNPTEVAAFFADLNRFEDITLFEPREFIEAGENVTVLGYLESFARETKQKYHSDWVHVSTVRDGKITRWRGFANTAAPPEYL